MRWTHALLCTAGIACLAVEASAQQQMTARIEWPRPFDLAGGPLSVQIQVQSEAPGYWLLMDHPLGGQPVQLAAGSGDVASGSTVYTGQLSVGAHRLELELHTSLGDLIHGVDLVATAPPLPGWPFQERLATAPSSMNLMAECASGEVVLARLTDPQRNAINMGELVWLDGQGQPLPGWPVAMTDLNQALSVRTEPLLVLRGVERRLLAASKTHLLEMDRAGQVLAQTPFNGLPVGEPVLLPLPGVGTQTLIYVLQQDVASLMQYDAGLAHVGGVPLPGLPAWSRPVLADMNGDGWLDLVCLVRVSGTIQVLTEDGRTGAQGLLANLEEMDLVSVASGDLDADGATDLVLVGRRGPVLALDGQGLRWTRELVGVTLGAAALVDVEGDGPQEVAFLSVEDTGGVRFRLLNNLGQDAPASGSLVASRGQAPFAPQWVRDRSGVSRFLVTLTPEEGVDWSTRCLWIDLPGQVQEPGWLLPGALSGAPRLTDLDGDGLLDLLAGDGFGRWVAWPTAARDLRPPHPLGDGRHGGVSLQPLPAGAQPGLLCGAMALPENYLLPDTVEVENLDLVRGGLTLSSGLAPRGPLWVGPAATLRLEPGAAWPLAARPVLEVEGLLGIQGDASEVAGLPHVSTAGFTNALVAGMDLRLQPGSRLELVNCVLHELEQPLALDHCQLDLRNSWILSGAWGVVAEGAVMHAECCLFQPGAAGLQFLGGSQALLRGCVVTSGDGTVINNQASRLEMRDCQVLTCQDALLAGPASVTLLDSVHFQGNRRDLLIASGFGSLDLQHCDFVETHEVGILNQSDRLVSAVDCHWDLQLPTQGLVLRSGDQPLPVQPLVIPAPVFSVDPGPLVDGDEPLEWLPVEFSVGGIPISVEYRIYRSDQPYGLVMPENLVAVTSNTSWSDPDHNSLSFYCVTASIGKQVIR